MKARSASAIATITACAMIMGCAQDGTMTTGALNTSTIGPQTADAPAAKADPVCLTLASQIEALKRGGVPEKVTKAAAKKYKMKPADLAKADELNKANAEFRAKCSNYPPSPTVATAAPAAPDPAAAPAAKTAAKPPVPAPKPVASAAPTSPPVANAAPTPPPAANAAPMPPPAANAAPTSPAVINEAVAQSPGEPAPAQP